MNTTEETPLIVKAFHPAVRARNITTDLLNSELLFSKVEEDSWEYPGTMFYLDKPSSVRCLVTSKCLEEELWLLGPYPDGGFWVTSAQHMRDRYAYFVPSENGPAEEDYNGLALKYLGREKYAGVVNVTESYGRLFQEVRAWSISQSKWTYGIYTVCNGEIYKCESRTLHDYDGDAPMPCSPVVSFPSEEMKEFIASFFHLPCDYPIVPSYMGYTEENFKNLCELKRTRGYRWSWEFQDFVQRKS